MNELLLAIFKDIDTHINAVVDKRVSEILANHATLNTINEELYDKISKIAKHEVNLHEAEHMHHERSDIAEIAQDAVDNYDFTDILNEHDFSDTIAGMVESKLDDTLDEAIEQKLNDTKFVITGGSITTEV